MKTTASLLRTVACLASLLALPAAHATLIALYTYDNAANLGQDSSGLGNNLLVSGGVLAGQGKYGGGLELNGFDAMLVSASGTLSGLPIGGSSYTISTWFNADTGGVGGFVGWGNYYNDNQVNALRMNGSFGVHNYWWNNDLSANSAVDLTAGSGLTGWHFVTATYDAVSHLNAIYLDGTLRSSRLGYGLNAQAGNFAVGRTVGSEFFDGQLDNTAIFNQALDQTQIATIMAGDYAAFGVRAVPEPGSLALAAGALGLLALGRRQLRLRRQRQG